MLGNQSKEKDSLGGKIKISRSFLLLLFLVGVVNAQDINVVDEISNLEPQFDAIIVSGVAKVFFTQEETKNISMTLSGSPYPQLIREIKNGILQVYTKGEARNEIVEIYVSNPSLKYIEVSDRAEFICTKSIKAKHLEVIVKDVGAADLDIITDEVSFKMMGGDITVSGKTIKQHISNSDNSGRGTLDNSNLTVLNENQ